MNKQTVLVVLLCLTGCGSEMQLPAPDAQPPDTSDAMVEEDSSIPPPPVDSGMAPRDSGTPDSGMAPRDSGVVDSANSDTGPRMCPDDGNPCTLARAGTCEIVSVPDGLACNVVGTCHGGACCEGCVEGSTCRAGTELTSCGTRGEMCEDCEAGLGECWMPTCTLSGCGRTPRAAGTPCTGGTCTGSGTCRGCGSDGEACCSGGSCAGGLSCVSGTCRGCGGAGEACCAGLTCEGALACSAGVCGACGDRGQPCCSGSSCGAFMVCVGPIVSRTCQCGGTGQPCCGDTFCTAPRVCTGSPGTRTCGF